MNNKDALKITMQLGLGIRDIKKLNVGHLGYANGWYWNKSDWFTSKLPRFLMQLCKEQGVEFKSRKGKWDCDTYYYNDEYNISYSVDSSG